MNVIYTQELDNAITIASVLHGVILDEHTIKGQDVEDRRSQIRISAQEQGYIKTIYNGQETLVVWGAGLIEPLMPSEYGIPINENVGFYPDEIRYKEKEGKTNEAVKLAEILMRPDNETIFDASNHFGNARYAFPSLYTYAHVPVSKTIYRVELEEYTKESINAAFSNPLSAEDSARQLTRDLTHQKLYYIANVNLKYLYPDQNSYPKFRDLNLLADIVERSDSIDKEEAKSRYIVNLQATYKPTGEICTLKSRKAEFTSKDEANEFVKRIPKELPVKVLTEDKWEKAPGLHSVSSICEAAKKEYNYTAEQVKGSLNRLVQQGFIKNANSSKRSVPENAIEDTFAIYKKLLKYPNLVPASLKAKGDNVKLEPDVISAENKSGIMLTKNIMTDTVNDIDRSVYYLIVKEVLKLYMGRKKTKVTKLSVEANGIVFTVSGTTLIYPGFSELDPPRKYTNDIPKDIQSEDICYIQYIKEKKSGNPPVPLTEQSLLKACTEGSGKIFYSPDEFTRAIASLVNKEFIIRKGSNLLATDSGTAVIHYLQEFPGLIDNIQIWELALDRITDKVNTSREVCNNLAVNIVSSATDSMKDYLLQRCNIAGYTTGITCPSCQKEYLAAKDNILKCRICGFTIERIQYGRRMDDKELKYLCKNGNTPLINGFNNGEKTVYGRLYFDEDGKLNFTEESIYSCPACKKGLHRNELGYFCASCNYTIKRKMLGHSLTGPEFAELLTSGKTPIISDLIVGKEKINGVLFIDPNDKQKVKCIRIVEGDEDNGEN